jgi:hypothetical protein
MASGGLAEETSSSAAMANVLGSAFYAVQAELETGAFRSEWFLRKPPD